MLTASKIKELLSREVSFHTSHAGGKGGQNVNKVETKVLLEFNVTASELLTDEEKGLILSKCHKVNKEGVLKISADMHRTQLQNKKEVISKFQLLLLKLFTVKRKRLATRPSKQSIIKKEKNKRAVKEKKLNRKKPEF